jgi:nitrogen fixation/metabolism regulation signal transduction histidine kinase
MSLRSRLILAFSAILLLAVVPFTIFTSRIAPFNLRGLENEDFGRSLEVAVANAKTPPELISATNALREYRQLVALREPLRHEFVRFSAILVCVLVLTSVGVIFLSINRITKPLNELVRATEQIAAGNTSVHLKTGRSGEFNILIDAFNAMSKSLDDARYRLRLGERHAAWREMARMLAHEIKNPLTPIRLSVQRLREKYLEKSADLPSVIDKTTRIIESETNGLVTLVDKFSEFAHLPSPCPEPTNINQIVKESADLYSSLPDVKLEEDYSDSTPSSMIDASQMKRAIGNIIKNAIEASKEGNTVKISTGVHGNEVEVVVTDSGKGMSPEDMEHMFHPYFTTKEEGTGLGMVITERIITEHRGKISVQSEEGAGTSVSIKLPVIQKET